MSPTRPSARSQNTNTGTVAQRERCHRSPAPRAFEFIEQLSSDLIAEDDLVVQRSTVKLRHVGEMFGIPPTDRVVTTEHVEMWRVIDAKIVEHWGGLGAGAQLYRALTKPVG